MGLKSEGSSQRAQRNTTGTKGPERPASPVRGTPSILKAGKGPRKVAAVALPSCSLCLRCGRCDEPAASAPEREGSPQRAQRNTTDTAEPESPAAPAGGRHRTEGGQGPAEGGGGLPLIRPSGAPVSRSRCDLLPLQGDKKRVRCSHSAKACALTWPHWTATCAASHNRDCRRLQRVWVFRDEDLTVAGAGSSRFIRCPDTRGGARSTPTMSR